ncbi:ATP-dependent DNA helicase Q4 isoform X1 [Dermacentor andersoni]|uniref:ATP-dependent DNA helicase Q4 isoform X1 n=1 Tax=Dermacentor andersoni TaxID=34620 RepID=UPI00215561E4|nr:ATP-dependent DNA helicase Q4-like isoform X1 [Dermacentor andersoni]
MNFNQDLQRLKVIIKEWEKTFIIEKARKPTSADIKDAPENISEAYSQYWKLKKSLSEPSSSVASDDGVWDVSLNRKSAANQKKVRPSSSSVYTNKVREKLLASFHLESSSKPGCMSHGYRSKSVQDEPVCPRLEVHKENSSSVALSKTDCKHVQAKECTPNEEVAATNEDRVSISPCKMVSASRMLYYTHSLDESWLSRNSIADDEVFFTPPSSSSQLPLACRPSTCSGRLSEKGYIKTKVSKTCPISCSSIESTDDVFLTPTPPQTPGVQQLHVSHHLALLSKVTSEEDSSSTQLGKPQVNTQNESGTIRRIPNTRHQLCSNKEIRVNKLDGSKKCLPSQAAHKLKEEPLKKACESFEVEVVSKKDCEKPKRKRQRRTDTASTLGLSGKKQETVKRRKTLKNSGSDEHPEVKEELNKPSMTDPDDIQSGSSAIQPRKAGKDNTKRHKTSKSLSENFVRINLKRKKFSRGHHKVNVRQLKYKEWKKKRNFSEGASCKNGTSKCFKCGELGHWARSCSTNTSKLEIPAEPEVTHLPTLEEAAEMARGIKSCNMPETLTKVFCSKDINQHQDRVENIMNESEAHNLAAHIKENERIGVQPLLKADLHGKLPETPKFVFETLRKVGFSEFRPGQETTIMRILCGLSTLLVSSTGSGKSLCYQLPAYLYAQKTKCLTLVVSPLISLMEDQVARLAPCLKASFLHSAMPPAQKEQVLAQLREGSIHFLLVSPESLVEGNSIVHQLPPVAFACIDEAHCLSEWSHNFRPSYLQLYKVLTMQLKVHCILALTATATRSTCLSIAEHLQIDNTSAGVIGSPSMPKNLILSVSEDKYRDEALIELLKGSRFGSCESIIVYCTRREETERLASLIRTSLQHLEKPIERDNGSKAAKSRRSYLAWDAEAYHAGMTSFRRRSVQKKFMTGKLRVVVATVAFGMGIDKADIRAIIHYNMPKSFENYVQEAGRAGRDGLTSHCHLFLEPEKKDQNELKRHIYANSVDRHVIRKLLKKVFTPLVESRKTEGNTAPMLDENSMYEIAIPIEAAVEELDLKEENILTLLCFLEFHPDKVVRVLSKVYATCTIKCYGGPQQMRSVASKNAAVAAAMALQEKNCEQEPANTLSFPVVDVAARMGWNSKLVKRDLKRLEYDNTMLHATGHSRKTGVIVEFSDLAFHLNVSASLTEEDCDHLLDYLYERVQKQEKMDIARLRKVHEAFQSASCEECAECAETASIEKSNSLKKLIEDYFDERLDLDDDHEEPAQTEPCLSSLRQEIRSLVMQHRDHSFNGRAVARIFHGIGSPCFPAQVWGRVHRFWRSFLDVDFNTIINIANKELLSLR